MQEADGYECLEHCPSFAENEICVESCASNSYKMDGNDRICVGGRSANQLVCQQAGLQPYYEMDANGMRKCIDADCSGTTPYFVDDSSYSSAYKCSDQCPEQYPFTADNSASPTKCVSSCASGQTYVYNKGMIPALVCQNDCSGYKTVDETFSRTV